MISPERRLAALKANGVIAGWEAPHKNHGRAKGMLPWVIMPISPGPAALFYSDYTLHLALSALEQFGPLKLTSG